MDCPKDTNGDGDCGRYFCIFCGGYWKEVMTYGGPLCGCSRTDCPNVHLGDLPPEEAKKKREDTTLMQARDAIEGKGEKK